MSQEMFGHIARRYDIANDVLSFGTHRLWRQKAVQIANIPQGARILDLCTGTGDLAALLAKKTGATGEVIGVDVTPEMIELAKKKYSSLSSSSNSGKLSFTVGDALCLPFQDNSFDFVTVAFGVRNLDSLKDGLIEMKRVLCPSGKLLVLEFGQPQMSGFAPLYRWYSQNIIPRIGQCITGNRAAYEYLPRTAQAFPAGERFIEHLKESGFSIEECLPLFGGIAYIYLSNLEIPMDIPQRDSKYLGDVTAVKHG